MGLTDYFPAAEVTAIQAHGSISFHALGDSGTGSAEQQAVAETMAQIPSARVESSSNVLFIIAPVRGSILSP